MTCERVEELLSAYLEGELSDPGRAKVEAHLAACSGCAALAGLMRKALGAAACFPEVEPSPVLLSKLYGIPEAKKKRGRVFRPFFDLLSRPALQPVYAAFTGLLIILTFVLFHPEGRGIRKQISVQFHRGVGTVEKLYAQAGGIKGEVGEFAGRVVRSFDTLGLPRGNDTNNK
jgi:hypothetical protein